MYLVATDHLQENLYSLPRKFFPVFDGITRELSNSMAIEMITREIMFN